MGSLSPRLSMREDGKEWRSRFLVRLGRTMQEGEQTDGCNLSSQISDAFRSSPSFSWRILSVPPTSVSPTAAITSLYNFFQHPIPWPISMNWFEVVRVPQTAKMIQMGVWFSSAESDSKPDKKGSYLLDSLISNTDMYVLVWFGFLYLN